MSDAASTLLKVSSAAVTSADFQSVLPFHSPVYFSGPSSPSSTFSSRCFCVHAGLIASAVLPLPLIVAAWVRNSFQVLGGPAMPSACSVLGVYQIRFERWMLTGTEYFLPSIVIASSRPLGILSFQPCASNSLVRSSSLPALMSSASSRPAWRWYESGGLPACRRLARIALALVPAPPDTAALTTSIGFFFLKSPVIAARPSCSPAPVHHENSST